MNSTLTRSTGRLRRKRSAPPGHRPLLHHQHHSRRPTIRYAPLASPLTPVLTRAVGAITLASSDPFAHPHIDPAFYTHPFDIAAMLHAVRDARRFAASPPWAGFVARPFGAVGTAETDAELAAAVRANSITIWHPVGTARMGEVVDTRLRVLGADGVRVVDASVLVSSMCLYAVEMVLMRGAAGDACGPSCCSCVYCRGESSGYDQGRLGIVAAPAYNLCVGLSVLYVPGAADKRIFSLALTQVYCSRAMIQRQRSIHNTPPQRSPK